MSPIGDRKVRVVRSGTEEETLFFMYFKKFRVCFRIINTGRLYNIYIIEYLNRTVKCALITRKFNTSKNDEGHKYLVKINMMLNL